MTAWCCKQVECKASYLKEAEFGKRSRGHFNGWASRSGGIRVVIGPESSFPYKDGFYPGRSGEAFRSADMNDQLEALIAVTAHEVTHIRDYVERPHRSGDERTTQREERLAVEAFRADRDRLVAKWSIEPQKAPAKPKKPRKQINAERAEKNLKTWERKLKLAETKVKKYRQQVGRYEREGVLAVSAKRNPKGGK